MNPGARYRGPWTGALDRIKVWDRSLVCCSVQYVLVSWRVGHRPSTAPGQRDSDCVCVCVCVHRRRDGTYNMFNCTAVIAACAVTAALAQSPRV